MTKATVEFQRRWRLADENGKSIAEGFTSTVKAEQWAREHDVELVEKAKPKK